MLEIASWKVPGMLAEAREIKTKDGRVFAYAANVLTMGAKLEVQTRDESMFRRLCDRVGKVGVFAGTFDVYGGQIRLALSTVNFDGEKSASNGAAGGR